MDIPPRGWFISCAIPAAKVPNDSSLDSKPNPNQVDDITVIDIIERYEKSDDKQYTKLYEGLKNLVMKKMRKAERHLKKLKE